ncbi:sterile alpha motif domain-containing protein 10 isoform X2 [Suncus etruscus]|nr:sterile alpha motif domain-containing protein 10 isoform X2 [Suncus etruscus]
MSAESTLCPLPRAPGTSFTWHDSRSQRAASSHPIKLLQQPGVEGSQPLTGRPHQARGPVDAAGCLQMAQEALSSQLPRLRGGLLPARHHGPSSAAAKCREAAADGAGAGGPAAGGVAAGPAPASSGGGAEPAAAEPSFLWKQGLAPTRSSNRRPQHCDGHVARTRGRLQPPRPGLRANAPSTPPPTGAHGNPRARWDPELQTHRVSNHAPCGHPACKPYTPSPTSPKTASVCPPAPHPPSEGGELAQTPRGLCPLLSTAHRQMCPLVIYEPFPTPPDSWDQDLMQSRFGELGAANTDLLPAPSLGSTYHVPELQRPAERVGILEVPLALSNISGQIRLRQTSVPE